MIVYLTSLLVHLLTITVDDKIGLMAYNIENDTVVNVSMQHLFYVFKNSWIGNNSKQNPFRLLMQISIRGARCLFTEAFLQ